ncbi:MAG: leucine-rich repeat domain-containing protein [Flavobacteriales bacterium]|nr:leucine-rich repeat domain-containing protein [Flavobacteriales bacterium]
MKNYLFFLVLFCFGISFGQSDVDLDTCKVFTSLEEAMKNPEEVYILDLSKTKLKVAPETISKLINLRELDLSKNKLSELPLSFSSLKFLEKIHLDKNEFKTFPVVLVELTKLKEISISQNEVYGIPFDIKNLQDLEVLDMWSNNLYEIPDSMSELKKLRIFDLRVIQFTDPEMERISKLLPNTKIHFSNSCNCSN